LAAVKPHAKSTTLKLSAKPDYRTDHPDQSIGKFDLPPITAKLIVIMNWST
jgi:hypothetical protein